MTQPTASPTLDTLFKRNLARQPDALALVDPLNKQRVTGQPPKRLTFAQADRMISALAAHFIESGLPSNSVIGVQLPNTIEFALTVLAAFRAGLVVAVLPLLWRQSELTMALNRTAARGIVTSGRIDGVVYSDIAMNAAAEAADMADRERFGCGVHREIRIDDAVDLARRHDRPRRGAVERHGQFRLPPEQPQHRDHEASAEGGEHREREFDRVRQLNRDHGIRRQSGFDEVRGQRRDHAVGLRVGKTFRRLSRHTLLVGRIDQRQRIRLPRQDAFEQRIERWRSSGLGHGVISALSRG